MIARSFYRFAEAVERLATDEETLKQAIALGNVSPFLRLRGTFARSHGAEDGKLDIQGDPYCGWRRWQTESRAPVISPGRMGNHFPPGMR